MIDAAVKTAWTTALRSGGFEQGRGQLREGHKYCCLGVLGVTQGLQIAQGGNEFIRDGENVGYRPLEDLGLDGNALSDLWKLNDGYDGFNGKNVRRHSFAEIADYIDGNL